MAVPFTRIKGGVHTAPFTKEVNLVKSTLKLTFTEWLLFPRLDYDGTVKLGKQGKANELSDLLEGDLKRYHLSGGETPHSFRHREVVDSLRRRNSLQFTM